MAGRGVRKWEADKRPASGSLGLLPSGPDPVGEGHVRRQPPAELSYECPPDINPGAMVRQAGHGMRCTAARPVLMLARSAGSPPSMPTVGPTTMLDRLVLKRSDAEFVKSKLEGPGDRI